MFKVEFWLSVIFERQGLVFFVEQRGFDDPGIDDLINEEPSPISGTRRARHVGVRRRDTHTAKCEHMVKHYCFIDIDAGSECIPRGTTSSRKEAGNWLGNLRASQDTRGCCRASESKLSTIFIAFSQKNCQLFHNVVCRLCSG